MEATQALPKQGGIGLVIDTLFILVLCFATLLSTMVLRGAVIVGSGSGGEGMEYIIDPTTFVITFVAMGGYMWYMLAHSNKELGNMVEKVYSEGCEVK